MSRRILGLAVLALAATALAPSVTANAAPSPTGALRGEKAVCAQSAVGYAHCHAHVVTKGGNVTPNATTSRSSGYISADLRTAYGLLGKNGTATVAIVDAFASPNARADLDFYRADTKLPALAVGQFSQANQDGGPISTVSGNTGWGQEEMLDLEMVSAICPGCKIVYVGANSASFADLGAAVNRAVLLGATVVSNSYGGSESSGEATIQKASYTHAGVAITVSSGDSGYGAESPAAFNTVTAVGGTNLKLNADGTRASETVWSGAGSGCSAYITKPSWQHDTGCTRRTIADVAAVADPATGVAVYDSYGSTAGANWYVFGGTSVAAPIIGGVYGLSGNTAGTPAALLYGSGAATLFDVTSGSNGRCTSRRTTGTAYLCTGGLGYDGPTGNGTPNSSLAAF